MLAIHQSDEETAAQFERAVANLREPDAAFTAETMYSLSDLTAYGYMT